MVKASGCEVELSKEPLHNQGAFVSHASFLLGLRRGVFTTATLGDATGGDRLVNDLGLTGRVRHGLRQTALTWMADDSVELHLLQRVAGHQDPAVTARYLHPDHQAVLGIGAAYSRWWGPIWAYPRCGWSRTVQ